MVDATRRQATDALRARIDTTAAEAAVGFPHYADPATGEWTRSPAGDWTGGFWVALLWLAARTTLDQRYATLAEEWVERLRPRISSETVFRGFLFWYGAALGAVLCGSDVAEEIARDAAHAIADQFNPAAQLIPLGNAAEETGDVGRDVANIDAVPGTAALLGWAAGQGGGGGDLSTI